MCGISGFWSRSGNLSQAVLARMNETIWRRGPDGDGQFFESGVGLAMRRLAIIDLHTGQQPIFNETRDVVVVFNGEIYNYRSLRERLLAAGHRFETHSDTEVLVHLYEEHGDELVQHLEGMFAFAIWDMRRKRLLLARDRLGIKPLFIAETGTDLLFASEIKALLASGVVSRDVDCEALDQFVTYTFIPAPSTIFRGVRKVPPGHTLAIEHDGSRRLRRYWSADEIGPSADTPAHWQDRVEAALSAAVTSHLVSDVPIGAFLSGGVDSGMIVAMLAKAAGEGVTAFTVGFQHAGAGFIDERPYARMIARRYGVRHVEIEVTTQVEEVVNEIVDAFDEPFADDSVFPTYYVCKAAAQHLKVILTGLGGDELFGGYRRHAGMALARSYGRLPRWLREGAVAPLARSLRESWLGADRVDHLKRFVRGGSLAAPQRYQDSMATLPWTERRALYQPRTLEHIDAAATERVMTTPFQAARELGDVERALRCDLSVYLPDDVLALTDRLGMWHSLELRVPYLDHRLVELVAAAPERLKIDGMRQKVLLKQLARRWLPAAVIDHRKQGFESPMGAWLRGPLRETMDRVLSRERIEAAGWFDWSAVQRLRAEHISGQRKHSKVLFSMMMAHLWRERYAS